MSGRRGKHASTLHHVQKLGPFTSIQAHGIHHYCSDITSSFPVNGKFTEKQSNIYSLVLKANRAVMAALRAGVSWVDMHLLAERVILEGLSDLEIVKGDI